MQINKPTALVLQGGGALGAYQYGILKALYEQRPNFVPKVVTGISIGAVNAAVLLGGKYGSIESLKKLWDSITMPVNPFIPQSWQAKASKMGNPSMYYLNPAYLLNPLVAGSIYDLSPFYELLESLIDFEKLNHPSTPRNGRNDRFQQRHPKRQRHRCPKYRFLYQYPAQFSDE
jgi:NTE family protein